MMLLKGPRVSASPAKPMSGNVVWDSYSTGQLRGIITHLLISTVTLSGAEAHYCTHIWEFPRHILIPDCAFTYMYM